MNFAKYGDELSDQQMKQFLRLEDINMNRSSKKGMSIEDQEALKRRGNSVGVVGGHYEVWMLWKSDTPWLPNNKQRQNYSLQRENSSTMRTFTENRESYGEPRAERICQKAD